MKRRRTPVGFVIAAAVLSLLMLAAGAEGMAALYTSLVLQNGKIYRTDNVLGWVARGNLDTKRKRGDGTTIDYVTDADGFRIARGERRIMAQPWPPKAGRRVLILGDSFAEGSVNIEYRLDRVLARKLPDSAFLCLGVGGYTLRAGDTVVLLTCGNDFEDLLRSHQFGRAKPWDELSGTGLTAHPPAIGLKERLRDSSYLVGWVLQRYWENTQHVFTPAEYERSAEIYRRLVQQMAFELNGRGIDVLVVHHSDWIAPAAVGVFAGLAIGDKLRVVGLDTRLGQAGANNPNFLPDDHWTERGYEAAGEAIAAELAANASAIKKAGR